MANMKALVSHPSGELKLEEVPVPELGSNRYAPHDVLCEVEYCGICGSDIHKWGARQDRSEEPRRARWWRAMRSSASSRRSART